MQLQNPALGLVPPSWTGFACSACPSAEIQDVTATFPVDVELLHQPGRSFGEGIGGFKVVVTSSSEPGLMGQSGEFTLRNPPMWVRSPEPDDIGRGGEDRLIRWEIDMPTSEYCYQRLVDIELLNVATNRRWTIAEAVLSDDLHGRRVLGHTRWHVDKPAGRYLVTVRMHHLCRDLQASSAEFTIE